MGNIQNRVQKSKNIIMGGPPGPVKKNNPTHVNTASVCFLLSHGILSGANSTPSTFRLLFNSLY
jgi:hypothetical protein